MIKTHALHLSTLNGTSPVCLARFRSFPLWIARNQLGTTLGRVRTNGVPESMMLVKGFVPKHWIMVCSRHGGGKKHPFVLLWLSAKCRRTKQNTCSVSSTYFELAWFTIRTKHQKCFLFPQCKKTCTIWKEMQRQNQWNQLKKDLHIFF